MTQITFYILSNSLYEEIKGEDAMRRMDVDKKIDEFKREYNLNVDFDAMGNLDPETVCAGIVQFIEDEENMAEDWCNLVNE